MSRLPLLCALLLCLIPRQTLGEWICAGPHPPSPGAAKIAQGISLEPVQGPINVLVVFAQFADDTDQSRSIPDYADNLFNPDLPGSFTHFYHTMSSGQVQIRGTVLPRRYSSLGASTAYISSNPDSIGQYGRFVAEILAQVDQDVDLGQFDNDGPDGSPDSGDDDGQVDYLFVNLRSVPRGFLLGPATGIAALGLKDPFHSRSLPPQDRGSVVDGAIQQEGTFAQTVGSMAHEFGHSLGLPDLYDRSFLIEPGQDPTADAAGIGRWGLMGWGAWGWEGNDGPLPFSAWTLEQLGWVGPANQRLVLADRDQQGLVARDLFAGGTVYKIPLGYSADQRHVRPREYLLLEYRSRHSHYYNRNLPAEGLLIWHVRPQKRNNDDEEAKLVDLICADGLYLDAGFPLGTRPDPQQGGDNLDFWAHDQAYSLAYGGNWGDSTDPFNGTTTIRLDPTSNPSTNIQGFLKPSSSGLSIALHPAPGAMTIDVIIPRWSGSITSLVQWADYILVDGDLTVAPGASLNIFDRTLVHLAATDRRQTGLDPDRIEVEIQGDLRIHKGLTPEKRVVFAPRQSGRTWHGIRLAPSPTSLIQVPDESYTLLEAQNPVYFANGPDRELKVDIVPRLLDGATLETAGNGNGLPDRGETVAWRIDIDNWTFDNQLSTRVDLRWNSRQVTLAWADPGQTNSRSFHFAPVDLFIGQQHSLETPALHIGPEALLDSLTFILTVRLKNETRRDTLVLAMGPAASDPGVQFTAPTHPLGETGRAVPIGLRLEERVAAAEVVVRDLVAGTSLVGIPLESEEDGLFAASFTPAEPGYYQFLVRSRALDGTQHFSAAAAPFLVHPSGPPPTALALVGKHYPQELATQWQSALDSLLTHAGLRLATIPWTPSGGETYSTLLPHFSGPDKLLIWMGQNLQDDALEHIEPFLKNGGRALFSTASFNNSTFSQSFRRDFLHLDYLSWPRWIGLRNLFGPFGESWNSTSSWLLARPPATPLLLDGDNHYSGLQVDNGTYRLVYFPFDLPSVVPFGTPLISQALDFLLHGAAAVQLSLDGRPQEATAPPLAWEPGRPLPVQVQTDASADSARLTLRSFPTLEPLAQWQAPAQSATAADRQFSFNLDLPDPGYFDLVLQLHDRDGRILPHYRHQRLLNFSTRTQALVLLPPQTDPAAPLRQSLAQELQLAGVRATFVELLENDEAIYPTLLEPYLGPGKVVLWLGARLEEAGQTAMQSFVEAGGRLLLASSTLHLSASVNPFFQAVLHLDRVSSVGARLLHTTPHLLGPELAFTARYGYLRNLQPPAQPLVVDDQDRPVGAQLALGASRRVFFPFDLAEIEPAAQRALLQASLLFLLEGDLHPATLTAATAAANPVLTPPGRPFTLEAHSPAPAARAQVVVHGPAAEAPQHIDLALQETGAQQVFRTQYTPPGPGSYQFVLRLFNAQGTLLPNPGRLEVLAFDLERPALLLQGIADSATVETGHRVAAHLESLGLNATQVPPLTGDGATYTKLLEHFLDDGEVVLWMGQDMAPEVQAAMRDFLEQGGRLLLASRHLQSSRASAGFLSDMLYFEKGTSRQSRRLTNTGIVEGAPLEFFARHVALENVRPPAQPLITSAADEIAALALDTGAYRLVYQSFEWPQLDPELILPLLQLGLRFLLEDSAAQIALNAPGHDTDIRAALMHPDTSLVVQARSSGELEPAAVVVRRYPGLLPIAQLPLVRREDFYSSLFSPDAPGLYQLSLRLAKTDSSTFESPTLLRVAALPLDRQAPGLAILDPGLKAEQRSLLSADLATLEPAFSLLDGLELDTPLIVQLLQSYNGSDQVVAWMGSFMVSELHGPFNRFLQKGGRLLLGTDRLVGFGQETPDLQRTLGVQAFSVSTREGLHFSGTALGQSTAFPLRFRPLDLTPLARPALIDEQGRTAALQIDQDPYRAAYLAFLPTLLGEENRRRLLQQNLLFLQPPSRSILSIQTVPSTAPVVELGPIAPQLEIRNQGARPSAPFWLGYQIWQDGLLQQTFALPQEALPPLEQRPIVLPNWTPPKAGALQLRFGLGPDEQQLEFTQHQELHAVQLEARFAAVALPGDLDQGNGAGFFDYDGDGDLDLYLVRLTGPDRLLRYQEGSFAAAAQTAGLADTLAGVTSRGLAFADYDGDGDFDLYLINEKANRFFTNLGQGTFAESTDSLGLGDDSSGRSAAFFDSDNDGDLDLYLVNTRAANRFYQSQDGAFTEMGAATGLADAGSGRGLGLADYDRDGDVDLLVANTSGGSHLYRNDGGTFTPVEDVLGLELPDGAVAAVWGDINANGRMDLLLANERRANQLFVQRADGTFAALDSLDIGGQSVGAALLDYDNDGDLDLATTGLNEQAGGHQLYHAHQGTFTPVGSLLDLEPGGIGRGLAAADYDGDGAVDLWVADNQQSRLYRNQGGRAHWLQVELAGTRLNPQAVGARIEVVAGGRRQVSQVQAGYGYASQVQPRPHIGLGQTQRVDTLRVIWPDGGRSLHTDLAVDTRLLVRRSDQLLSGGANNALPEQVELAPNYPNPFNNGTIFRFALPRPQQVELVVFNLLGQQVATLLEGPIDTGHHRLRWDGRDATGRPLATGLYIYRLRSAEGILSRKLLLLR